MTKRKWVRRVLDPVAVPRRVRPWHGRKGRQGFVIVPAKWIGYKVTVEPVEPIPLKVAFRIRRIYFDQIKAGTKKVEVRRASPYWMKAMMRGSGSVREVAVFVYGPDVHRREITAWSLHDNAEEVLGRELSAQGKKDVGRGKVIAVHLGEVVR